MCTMFISSLKVQFECVYLNPTFVVAIKHFTYLRTSCMCHSQSQGTPQPPSAWYRPPTFCWQRGIKCLKGNVTFNLVVIQSIITIWKMEFIIYYLTYKNMVSGNIEVFNGHHTLAMSAIMLTHI